MSEEKVQPADTLIQDLNEVATMAGDPTGPLRGEDLGDCLIFPNASIAIGRGKILAVGRAEELRGRYQAKDVVDGTGRVATPGLVDPHTHLVYAGSREEEFEARVRGATYLEIAAQGGGILSSVRTTRKASVDELVRQSLPRLRRALRHGTTTIEIKSGYGLDPDSEERMLEAISFLREVQEMDIVSTFLGAHWLPEEYGSNRRAYIRNVIEKQLPRAKGKAEFCDVFCEEGVFTPDESRAILRAAKKAGFGLKIHADEFKDTGGAVLAGEVGATSADHLGGIAPDGIEALRKSGTVAVLLPGTTFYVGLKKYAPARKMIDAGVAVAIATDGNPGSCVTDSMQVVLSIACLRLKMTPYEALAAATRNAAWAIGRGEEAGTLEPGRPADIVIWNAHSLKAIPHHFGTNLVERVYKRGVLVHTEEEGK